MITDFMQRARKVGLCAVVAAVWAAPSFGWPFAAAAVPFAAGLCMYIWRQES